MAEVIMPRLSDTMEEGVLSRWLKQVGDSVAKGDSLAEIETDKATMDLEAFDAGVLEEQLVEEGTTVPIGQTVAVIGDGSGTSAGKPAAEPAAAEKARVMSEESAGQKADQNVAGAGSAAAAEGEAASADAESVESVASVASVAPASSEPAEPASSEPAAPAGSGAQTDTSGEKVVLRTSPLARKIARENGIDLATITGSGPDGRIVRADVEDAVAAAREAGPATGTRADQQTAKSVSEPTNQQQGQQAGGAGTKPAATALGADDEKVPLNNIRRVTAKRLAESQAVPHFFLTTVVNVEKLLALRSEINTGLAETGVKVSVNDLVVRAVAVTLRAHPNVNSSWAGDSITRYGHVNVGFAVATESGLIVPVIKDSDRKALSEISRETAELAERARAGRLKPDEFSGGTFTVSNLGMFGIDQFTAIINPPEAAILAVGAASQEPIVRDGQLVSVSKMKMTMTVDHRVLDGAAAAAFLRDLTKVLEEPLRIVV